MVLRFPGRELEGQLATEFYSRALVTRGERHTYMTLGSLSPVICSEGQEPAATGPFPLCPFILAFGWFLGSGLT